MGRDQNSRKVQGLQLVRTKPALYTQNDRCTHRLDAYEVIKMAYMNRFINDDGFEEWTTTDAAGNLVTCYANKFVELHTKIPVCECGRPMTEEVQGYWTCRECDITKTEDEINHPIKLDEYESSNLELSEDYGKFEYDDGRMLEAGVPDWYLFFYQHRPK